jgi:hypothetical protein
MSITDLDHWCWQLQALDDLARFVEQHGPTHASPLPVLNWTLGSSRSLGAELSSAYDHDPVEVLARYARVLGVPVQERHLHDRVIYFVRGWIGKPEGTDRRPRTALLIRATVFHPLDDQESTR